MITKKINQIGIELEGGWNHSMYNHEGYRADRSVVTNAYYNCEVVSKPISTKKEIIEFINNSYPDVTSSRCGMHIHMSFINDYYYQLTCHAEFTAFLIKKLREWGKKNTIKSSRFWNRLNGYNGYCKNSFNAEIQLSLTNKTAARYTMINYPYNMHHTIEIRVLPMFKSKKLAYLSITEVIKITEEWLAIANDFFEKLGTEFTIFFRKKKGVIICV